jgi:hypothetical protein
MHNPTSVRKCKEYESQALPSTVGIHFGSWRSNTYQIFGLKVKITNLVQIESFLIVGKF